MHSIDELNALDSTVETIIVDNNACGSRSFTVLNLTRFVNLRVFEVGDHSFCNVEEVHLTGLSKLERVVIGEYSFTRESVDRIFVTYTNRKLYIRNCEKLRELKIGHYSFWDYSVLEIENVNSLEVIEIGVFDERSFNFVSAALELRSDDEEKK